MSRLIRNLHLSNAEEADLRHEIVTLTSYLCDMCESETDEQRANRARLERRLALMMRMMGVTA